MIYKNNTTIQYDNKYNNTYYSIIKMKPVDVQSSTHTDFDKKNNKEDSKFKVGDHIRILECRKTLLQKVTFQIGPKKLL